MANYPLYILLLLFSGNIAFSQPTMNERHNFTKFFYVHGSIEVNDSCYYLLGTSSYDSTWHQDVVFTKMDFDGTILSQNVFHEDTLSMECWVSNSLTPTSDGNFVSILTGYPYNLFAKFTPEGDTVFCYVLDSIYDVLGDVCVSGSHIIPNADDTSYTIMFGTYNETPLEDMYAIMLRIDNNGEIYFYKTFPVMTGPYDRFKSYDFSETSDGGYIIGGVYRKFSTSAEDEIQNSRVLKTDFDGNILDEWIDTDNTYRWLTHGIRETVDGGYLFVAAKGYLIDSLNATKYFSNVVKLDADLEMEWEIEIDTSQAYPPMLWEAGFLDMISTSDSEFVACGTKPIGFDQTAGQLVKFNLNGEVIWDSYITKLPNDFFDKPEHIFRDVEQTPDGGFVMVGLADDNEATSTGESGQWGWIVKVDSFGCLVPGCQDVLDLETIESPVNIGIYPNPASDILNIYYHDAKFSENTTLSIRDINGKVIKTWELKENDMTYVLEIGHLPNGTYLVQIHTNGDKLFTEKFIKH